MSKLTSEEIDQILNSYIECKNGSKKQILYLKAFENCLDIVKKMARIISGYSKFNIEDITQVGSVGLMKAIQTYNPIYKVHFRTYATYIIRGEISHYIRDKSHLIKLPRRLHNLFSKVSKTTQSVVAESEFLPTKEDLAKMLSLSTEEIENVLNIDKLQQTISLDQYYKSDKNEQVLLEQILTKDYKELIELFENKILLKEMINSLPEDLQKIIIMNYFDDISQKEIAKLTNLSQMQVSRKIRKALHKMYKYIKNKE